jgi:glycosyltransferase involved in cell wall biosynthesis
VDRVVRRVPWAPRWNLYLFSFHALRAVRSASADYDVAVVSQSALATYARALHGRVPWVLDAHNVETAITASVGSTGQGLSAMTRWLDTAHMRREERWLFAHAARVVTVSEDDAAEVRREVAQATVSVRPNGVDLAYFSLQQHEAPAGDRLVMTGHFGYAPNARGAVWFVHQVLPLLKRRRPETTVTLVGIEPTAEVLALHDPSAGVVVTGRVPDVRPYLAAADAFVVPVHSGGGTRLKALEALAVGLPTVSTTMGVAGIELGSDPPVLVADDPPSFAAALDTVLGDVALRRRMIRSGRDLVSCSYDWQSIGAALEGDLLRIAEHD